MSLNLKKNSLPTKPASLADPKEKARILMLYAGIFPNQINAFAKTIPRLKKQQKNFSK